MVTGRGIIFICSAGNERERGERERRERGEREERERREREREEREILDKRFCPNIVVLFKSKHR